MVRNIVKKSGRDGDEIRIVKSMVFVSLKKIIDEIIEVLNLGMIEFIEI